MFDNLTVFEDRYEEITQKLYDPDVVSDPKQYAELMKEHKNIAPILKTNNMLLLQLQFPITQHSMFGNY